MFLCCVPMLLYSYTLASNAHFYYLEDTFGVQLHNANCRACMYLGQNVICIGSDLLDLSLEEKNRKHSKHS